MKSHVVLRVRGIILVVTTIAMITGGGTGRSFLPPNANILGVAMLLLTVQAFMKFDPLPLNPFSTSPKFSLSLYFSCVGEIKYDDIVNAAYFN